jgi:hypothetical protein
MANLTQIEMQKFEALLSMGGGYVLNFSSQNFDRFVKGIIRTDIFSSKYETYGSSKAKRLRALWEIESDSVVGKLLEELINYYQGQLDLGVQDINKVSDKIVDDCLTIACKLQGKEKKAAAKGENFLSKEIDETPIAQLKLPSQVASIIEQRMAEIKKCLNVNSPLSVLFLAGSVLEGVLLNVATQNPSAFNQAKASPKDKSGKVKPFPEWTLHALIEVAHELNIIGLDVKKHSHSLRDFRNFIHPFEQMSTGFTPDSHTAEITWKVLKAALHDISSKV